MIEIIDNASFTYLMDHHASSKDDIMKLLNEYPSSKFKAIHDLTRSGAMISWNYFHPEKESPLAAYVQDRDIWTWKLPNSKLISEALFTDALLRNFDTIEQTAHSWTDSYAEDLAKKGKYYLDYQERLTKSLIKKASRAIIQAIIYGEKRSYLCLIVNSSILNSEIGNMLCNLNPDIDFAAIWNYRMEDDKIYCSLRATKQCIDLSKISQGIIGGNKGGGHSKAAAFSINGCNITAVFTFIPPITKEIK